MEHFLWFVSGTYSGYCCPMPPLISEDPSRFEATDIQTPSSPDNRYRWPAVPAGQCCLLPEPLQQCPDSHRLGVPAVCCPRLPYEVIPQPTSASMTEGPASGGIVRRMVKPDCVSNSSISSEVRSLPPKPASMTRSSVFEGWNESPGGTTSSRGTRRDPVEDACRQA